MHEGMADLIYLMNTLLDSKGNILVPGKVCCLHLHLFRVFSKLQYIMYYISAWYMAVI